jgi:hypothetical protein
MYRISILFVGLKMDGLYRKADTESKIKTLLRNFQDGNKFLEVMLKILLSHKTYIGGTISDYQIGILLIFI